MAPLQGRFFFRWPPKSHQPPYLVKNERSLNQCHLLCRFWWKKMEFLEETLLPGLDCLKLSTRTLARKTSLENKHLHDCDYFTIILSCSHFRGSMAEWLEHWPWKMVIPNSSPSLTTSWIGPTQEVSSSMNSSADGIGFSSVVFCCLCLVGPHDPMVLLFTNLLNIIASIIITIIWKQYKTTASSETNWPVFAQCQSSSNKKRQWKMLH